MIETTRGNLLEADAEALVNAVNCVGAMGKGIALQFKRAFPDNFTEYARACKGKEIKPGKVMVFETGNMPNQRYIINFPTKRHWKGKSRMEDIESGLTDLIAQVERLTIQSIAVPPLGAGLGGLNWHEVRQRIEAAFAKMPDVRVLLFEPESRPLTERIQGRTEVPKMTPGRALLIRLLDRYRAQGYRHGLLEVQKLAYFLQEAGEPMRLIFEKGRHGPYADNLNHVLQRIEGHFIRGYGACTEAQIHPLPDALDLACKFLEKEARAAESLERVRRLIDGFETPYSLEVLSMIHWIVKHEPDIGDDLEAIGLRMESWNEGKKNPMNPDHIQKAWSRLKRSGFISA